MSGWWNGWLGEGPPLITPSPCSGPALMFDDAGDVKISQTVPEPRAPPWREQTHRWVIGSTLSFWLVHITPQWLPSYSMANGYASVPIIYSFSATSGPADLTPSRPLQQPPRFPRPGHLPQRQAPNSGSGRPLLHDATSGRRKLPYFPNFPQPQYTPGPTAYKIANSCCDHGLPRPQGPWGKRANGNLERELSLSLNNIPSPSCFQRNLSSQIIP